MDEEIKKYINQIIEDNKTKDKRGFIKRYLFEIITCIVASAALTVSYLSYRISYGEANPESEYNIINDIRYQSGKYAEYLNKYYNNWEYNEKDFSFGVKIVNQSPGTSSRFDEVSGQITIDFYKGIYISKTRKLDWDKITSEQIFLTSIPIKLTDGNDTLVRPTINDLFEGEIVYSIDKDDDIFSSLGRMNVDDIYDEIRKYGNFSINTRLIGNLSYNYEPEDEDVYESLPHTGFYRRDNVNPESFSNKIYKVIVRTELKISDHLGKSYNNRFSLSFDALLDNPFIKEELTHNRDLINQGEFEGAQQKLINLYSQNKYHSELNYLLALTYLHDNDIASAKKHFKIGSKRIKESNLELAKILIKEDDLHATMDYLKSVFYLDCYTKNEILQSELFEIEDSLINELLLKKEIIANDRYLKNSFSDCLYYTAMSFVEIEDTIKSIKYLNLANNFNNRNLDIIKALGEISMNRGKYQKSLNLYKKAIEIARSDNWDISGCGTNDLVNLIYNLGKVYRLKGDYKNALQTYKDMASDVPDGSWNFFMNLGLGMTYKELGEMQISIDKFELAKSIVNKNEYINNDNISSIDSIIVEIKKEHNTLYK